MIMLIDVSQIDVGLWRIDAIDSTYTAYIGNAPTGTAETATGWSVKRIIDSPGTATDRKYASGKWSDRYTLTYS